MTTYVQRVYDTTLVEWCWYRKTVIDPTPLTTDTTPNHTGSLLAGSHEVVLVEDAAGIPVPVKFVGATDATVTTVGAPTTIGAVGAFDPSLFQTPDIKFEVTAIFSPGTAGTAEIRLYDMGTRLAPTAGVLRSSVVIPFADAGIRQCISKTLTQTIAPGVDADEILPSERVYQVRVELVGANLGDAVTVENASVVVTGAFIGGGGTDVVLQEWDGVGLTQFMSGGTPDMLSGTFGGFARTHGTPQSWPLAIAVGSQFTVVTDAAGGVPVLTTVTLNAGSYADASALATDIVTQLGGNVALPSSIDQYAIMFFAELPGAAASITLADGLNTPLATMGVTPGTYTGAAGSPTLTVASSPGSGLPSLRVQVPGMTATSLVGWVMNGQIGPQPMRMRIMHITGYSLGLTSLFGLLFNYDVTRQVGHALSIQMLPAGLSMYLTQSDYLGFLALVGGFQAGYYYETDVEIPVIEMTPYPEFFLRARTTAFVPPMTPAQHGALLGAASNASYPYAGGWTAPGPALAPSHAGLFFAAGGGPQVEPIDIYIPLLRFERLPG